MTCRHSTRRRGSLARAAVGALAYDATSGNVVFETVFDAAAVLGSYTPPKAIAVAPLASSSGSNQIVLTSGTKHSGQIQELQDFSLSDADGLVLCNSVDGARTTHPFVINLFVGSLAGGNAGIPTGRRARI